MSTTVKTDISLSAIALCIAVYLGSAYSQSLAYSWPVASPASGHVGTCPPLAFEKFFSLYVEINCLVWFGTMPNS